MSDQFAYDVVIVGAGPAGLAAAIRLKQLAAEKNTMIHVAVLEKGSEVGAHILSGAVMEPRALDALLPNWRDEFKTTPAKADQFIFLTPKSAFRLPTPPDMNNHGNHIISLANLCRYLAEKAQGMGVEIFPGFAVTDAIYKDGRIVGVKTGDFGRDKKGEPKPEFQPGVEIEAKYVLAAEGCRGSLSEKLIRKFDLRMGSDPQSYAIGIKELWEIDPKKSKPGHIVHSVGWPLDPNTYGGSFMYHLDGNQLSIGFVVGLDYENPWMDPYEEFQKFKTHPAIRKTVEGGRRIAYGARALTEGGWQSIPKLIFPGGALIGDSAGFMNVPKIKGSHTAMQSGMYAAEAIAEAFAADAPALLESYPEKLRASWVIRELYEVRNIRPAFHHGMWLGMLYAALERYVLKGRAPWTLRHVPDHTRLKLAANCPRLEYPRPDGVLTFDRMSSVQLSGVTHAENQPVHLTLKDPVKPVNFNLVHYAAPEQRYCPAGVYEIVQAQEGPKLQINAQNCVHCKTCDIKDPTQNIVWVPPEGGGGPKYPNM